MPRPTRPCLLLLSLVLLLPGGASASPQDVQQLAQKATAAYAAKDYAASADAWAEAIAAGGDDPVLYYNAACASALAGRKDAALDLLGKATAGGYNDLAAIRADADLLLLHDDARFESLLAGVARDAEARKRMWSNPAWKSAYQPTLDEDARVAGLSRLWSEAKYNFANFDLVPELDLDRLYIEALPQVRAATRTEDYYRVLRRFIAQLHDGHSSVRPPAEVANRLDAHPGLRTALVEGRVFVVGLLDPALGALGLAPGMEIVSVEGQPVRAWADARIAPYQPASTPQDRASRTYERALLSGPVEEAAHVVVRDAGGRQRTLALPRMAARDYENAYWGGSVFEMRMLPGNIAYVRILHFGDSSAADGFREHFDEISRARGLVIDVRENGGGNSGEGYKILSMLTDRPFEGSRWKTREYVPAFRAWGRPEGVHAEAASTMQPDGKRHYAGPVLVLTSARTYSAAEDFVVAFDAMHRGRIVGEPTGGSTGQPLIFDLPGGGTARVCTKRDAYPDGRDFVGVGIQPQVRAAPTVADLRAGRDTVLDTAVALVGK